MGYSFTVGLDLGQVNDFSALAVVERVRVLHRPWTGGLFPECETCGPDTGRAADDQYPCATVQALDAIDAPEEPARHG